MPFDAEGRYWSDGSAPIITAVPLTGGSETIAVKVPARHGDPRFYKLLEELAELHSRKNHDYAVQTDPLSNFRMCEQIGLPAWKGVVVRLMDKWARITHITGGKQPKNESLRDSLIDNAVYSLLAILLLEEAER